MKGDLKRKLQIGALHRNSMYDWIILDYCVFSNDLTFWLKQFLWRTLTDFVFNDGHRLNMASSFPIISFTVTKKSVFKKKIKERITFCVIWQNIAHLIFHDIYWPRMPSWSSLWHNSMYYWSPCQWLNQYALSFERDVGMYART